ncbi:nascent polypeptide-associated complex subunit family protein [Bacillus sp. ISL-47]|uniref:nascent polypeptide-associated complex subunit family protein n=1 Tax=Bacillus sp. ISL-47 TaxID=2819130 RepID=UPI001BE6BC15|nr:nascent polypeptide-associated complex subunit family protein [Bacillus sp. ISL-47]MBT2689750.1 nascent polypeptide-associated complex subunit family protein [Bacillus sp. ISL-47]MBT2710163.1 nascent polypeptide-associated complex subunit family protein [Pseudomonas sp. ISL-84]
MKRNWKNTLIGIGILFIILFVMDQVKVKRESVKPEPPMMVFHNMGEEVPYNIGNYRWEEKGNTVVAGDRDPYDLIQDMAPFQVNPEAGLEMITKQKPVSVELGYRNGKEEVQFKTVKFEPIPLPERPGKHVMIVRVKWEEEYIFLIGVSQSFNYEKLLSDKDGSYSLLAVVPEPMMGILKMPEPACRQISKMRGSTDLYGIQEQFPELNIQATPAFYLFNNRDLEYQSQSWGEVIDYLLPDNFGEHRGLSGTITAIDYKKSLVTVGDGTFYWDPYAVHTFSIPKVGQEVHASVTFFDQKDPMQTRMTSFRISKEADPLFHEAQWRAEEPEKYAILAVGNEEEMRKLNLKELPGVGKVNIRKPTKMKGSFDMPSPIFMIFDQNMAIFLAADYHELVDYLEMKSNQ